MPDKEQGSNVASMPEDTEEKEENGGEDAYFDKFKSALGKRNLQEFVEEKAKSSKKAVIEELMPFLNVENGVEDAATTEGILPLLNVLELPNTRTCGRSRESGSSQSHVPLLHVQQKDKWSCGFRNLQISLSALIPLLPSDHPYHAAVPPSLKRSDLGVAVPIPSIKDLQEFLERAWQIGIDPRGAGHYGGKIVGTDQEIGAVEVFSILTALYIDATVVQFIKSPDSRQLLGPFIWSYFGKRAGCDCVDDRESASVAEDLLDYAETLPRQEADGLHCVCPAVPLYLQYNGHSVTVIGIRKLNGPEEYQLLVLDPDTNGGAIHRTLSQAFELPKTLDAIEPLVFDMSKLEGRDCQVVMVTKRHLAQFDIEERTDRINVVTAAREAVAKAVGIGSVDTIG